MDEIKKYLAEEVAIDHADGLVTRREALRRLGLLGVAGAAAVTLLEGCSKGGSGAGAAGSPPAASGSSPAAGAAPGASSAIAASPITFDGPEGRKLQGVFAQASKPRGAVLVIHENRGLTDHIKSVAGRLGGAGYSALALDLLSEEGGTASLGDSANATAALTKIAPERFVADMRAGLDELSRRAPGAKLGATGFCFGGGMTWRLIGSKDPRLAAAAPFYGPLPEGADFTGSKAAVLAFYAELDSRVNGSRDAARAALEKAGVPHEIVTAPKADHAFFNDTGPRYNAEAASMAWGRLLAWFGTYLG